MRYAKGEFRPEPCAVCGRTDPDGFARWRAFTGGTWAREGYWALCPRCSDRLAAALSESRRRGGKVDVSELF